MSVSEDWHVIAHHDGLVSIPISTPRIENEPFVIFIDSTGRRFHASIVDCSTVEVI
jgi:hypothetical protein